MALKKLMHKNVLQKQNKLILLFFPFQVMWLIFLFIHCCIAQEEPAQTLPPEAQPPIQPWETGFSDQYKSENVSNL